MYDVIIIGAGLTGLCVARKLLAQGKKIKIIEAKSQIGGRIETIGIDEDKPIEMGATWFGSQHLNLLRLLEEFEVEFVNQEIGNRVFFEPLSTSPPYLAEMPLSNDPSFRIKGGTQTILKKLVKDLPEKYIKFSEQIKSIELTDDGLCLRSKENEYFAKRVISTLPPNLLVNEIDFHPELPKELLDIACTTHTWMSESIKVALSYPRPFWRDENSSGTIFSNVGPINEMYDHSDDENGHYALMGFLNGSYSIVAKELRLEKILGQLRKYYGEIADKYLKYYEKIWREDAHVFCNYGSSISPHQNQGHEIYKKTFLSDTFVIAGTETSPHFPGYMEGAIYSANTAAEMIE